MKKILCLVYIFLLAKPGFSQVNLQSGTATFNVPVFSWADDKSRLNSVIALSYSSGNGLKVSDVASCIGQGWGLIAGGSITRLQAGEPDDQKPREVADLTKYPAGYLYDNLSATDGCPPDLVKYPIFPERNKLYKNHNSISGDRELDRFVFTINGRSGVFVLGKNNGDKGIVLGDEKLKIWFTRNENMTGIRTVIDAFYVQDENGLIYKFTSLEKTKVQTLKYSDKSHTIALAGAELKGGNVYHETNFDEITINPFVVNGWNLTEIEDALTHSKITIEYLPRLINSIGGVTLQHFAEKSYSVITYNKAKSESKDIFKIHYPDGHEVTFNYLNPRVDLNGGYTLNSIDVTYDSRFVQKLVLNSNYFLKNTYGIPLNDEQKKNARLCLQSVQKFGVDLKSEDPPFEFEYYLGGSSDDDFVPAPFSAYKDIFGYFNGNESRDISGVSVPLQSDVLDLNNEQVKGLCYLRYGSTELEINPKEGYAKNGILKKIKYPSGSSLEYKYAQNYYNDGSSTKVIGGVHVEKTIMRDGGNNIDCEEITAETKYEYVRLNGTPSFWGYEKPVSSSYSEAYYAPESKKYKLLGCGSLLGCCRYKYQYPGILFREQGIDLTGREKTMLAMEKIMNVVSLVMQVWDVVRLVLNSTAAGAIIAVALDVLFGAYILIRTCTKDFSDTSSTTVYYNFDLNSANPLPGQYNRVVVTEGAGSKGRTVMEFTDPASYAIWENANPTYSNKQRYANWAYGLPLKTSIYSASNLVDPVKVIENEYDFTNAKRNATEIYVDGVPQSIATDYASCKCDVKKSNSNRSDHWATPDLNTNNFVKNMTSSAVLKADISTISNGWVELRKTREKNYKPGSPSNYLETVTDFNYGKNHLPSIVTVTQSNGDKNAKSIFYTSDAWAYGTNAGKLIDFAKQNMLNIPVYTRETLTKAGSGLTYDLHEKVTEFALQTNGDIKPEDIKERRYAAPTPVSAGSYYYQGPSAPNTGFIKVNSVLYDDIGNPVQVSDEGGRKIASIYDYNNKFVVAKIINQTQVTQKVRACYTSFETASSGGWQIGGASQFTSSMHITGNRAFVLNGSNSLTPSFPNSGQPYILSFWATNNSISINANATLIKSGPSINGLTYYEYNVVKNNSTEDFLITGNCTLDELRFYDKMARMQTVTYDPLIGKTSDCDENNRITYYEYDEKGRMRFIKDDYGNVLKMYEYNQAVKKLNPACSTNVVYTHPEISETFVKNDCLIKDTYGTSVVYTIPAGTYTSTISQQVVNGNIQHDLETNAQAYANAHGECKDLFFNIEKSQSFTKEACDPGYAGSTVTYTVPARRYSSRISIADANLLADQEIVANGQANANSTGTCNYTTDPQWEGTGNTRCEVINAVNTGYLQYELINVNPHSANAGALQWQTSDEQSAACGGNPVVPVDITYTNTGNTSATVTMSNGSQTYSFHLLPNTSTSTITGSMLPGTYNINVTLSWGSSANTIQVYSTVQTGGSFSQNNVSVTSAGTTPMIKVY